jgi:hypothetical protein
MASGDTDISICSDALILLGAAPISSFADGTDIAQACERLYPDLRDSLISRYPWSWSYQKVKLARLAVVPDNEFRYAYALPGDMLSGIRAIFADSSTHQLPIRYGWQIFGEQLYTNLETVYIDYQTTVNEAKMPAYFVRLLRTVLAGELGLIVTDQLSKTDYYNTLAFGTPGENGRGGLFREAMNVDSRGNAPQVIEDYSLIYVRG